MSRPSGRCQHTVFKIFSILSRAWVLAVLALAAGGPALAAVDSDGCPAPNRRLSSPDLGDMVNPDPLEGDFILPLPCGGQMVFRHVCLPGDSLFDDTVFRAGCRNCGETSRGYMEGGRDQAVSGTFRPDNLTKSWKDTLVDASAAGDGRCPSLFENNGGALYYFMGKYEVSRFQYNAVMTGKCEDPPYSLNDPRPMTNLSWYDAVEFARQYTQWLLENHPDKVPGFSQGRSGFIRLPTEAEWEYAALGGQKVMASMMGRSDFFPLKGKTHSDYAVFTADNAAKPPENLAWIGSKCPNPLGLYDMAGNAAEMMQDPFHFVLQNRFHGAVGGTVAKGGSYLKRLAEIMPGRREELPLFLDDEPYRAGDVGFRVVLSGILTPAERLQVLEAQWKQAAQSRKSVPSGDLASLDQIENPAEALDRLMQMSPDQGRDQGLAKVRDLVEKTQARLSAQLGATCLALIQNAMVTAENLYGYAARRRILLNELKHLERVKAETGTQSLREVLEIGVANSLETVTIYESAIQYMGKTYLEQVAASAGFEAALFENQLATVTNKVSLEGPISRSLKDRLKRFKGHVEKERETPGALTRQQIIEDIVPKDLR